MLLAANKDDFTLFVDYARQNVRWCGLQLNEGKSKLPVVHSSVTCIGKIKDEQSLKHLGVNFNKKRWRKKDFEVQKTI